MTLIIELLIFLLVAAIIIWLASWIVGNLPVPPMVRNIILAIVGLLLLLYFLQRQGLVF